MHKHMYLAYVLNEFIYIRELGISFSEKAHFELEILVIDYESEYLIKIMFIFFIFLQILCVHFKATNILNKIICLLNLMGR